MNAPKNHDLSRDSQFWNRLQGAMIAVGEEGIGEPVSVLQWCVDARDYFHERQWKNRDGIYNEHIAQVAKQSPLFDCDDAGITMTRKAGAPQ